MLFASSNRPEGLDMTFAADQVTSSHDAMHRADIIDDILEIIDILLGGGGDGDGDGDDDGDGDGDGGNP